MVKSWDIFDTLIARKHIHPSSIFQMMEQKYQLKGFANARVWAESAVIQEHQSDSVMSYSIDDIYEKLCAGSNLTKEVADKLKHIECKLEVDQAIPIMENIKQVRAGDVLVSDMYLPQYVIEAILEKVGLRVPVEIVITNDGKRTGRIWQQMKAQNAHVSHCGDNYLSDIKNPKLCGFEAMLALEAGVTDVEKALLEKDERFACYLRELRLRNPFLDAIRKIYWRLFVVNIGILMIFAKKIHGIRERYGVEYLGFCGRDTYYLQKIYKKYLEQTSAADIKPVNAEYLYYSRALFVNSGKELGEYISYKAKGKKSLLVDLRGSGSHLTKLRETVNLDAGVLLCIWLGWNVAKDFYKDNRELQFTSYEDADSLSGDASNLYIMKNMAGAKEGLSWDDSLELMNRTPHNSPIGMELIHIDGKVIPKVVFSGIDDTEYFEVFERCMEIIYSEPMQFPENDAELESMAVLLLNAFYEEKGIVFRDKQARETMVNSIAFGRLI